MITETSHLSRLEKTDDTNEIMKQLRAVPIKYDTSIKVSGLTGDASIDARKLNAQKMMDQALRGFSVPNITASFRAPSFGPPVKGDKDSGDIISQLIKIILTVIQLPIRFGNMFKSLMDASVAMAKSVNGLGKSVQLMTQDAFTLMLAIVSIVFKYWMCLLSFTITTIGGCFLVHGITFACSVLYLIFPLTAFFIKTATTYDIMPLVNAMFSALSAADDQLASVIGVHLTKWPKSIQTVCYTCFGKPVKLRDIATDLGAISEIGDMISYDVSKRIPRYMQDAIPPGRSALTHLDLAMK